ncbi:MULTISPECIES: 50S ribosomal protein L25/general stress protein Ctc [unclassified Sporosarcina]|uniref:50S ribosomal protein L25/general stress protein Ctc n=1 Tax=unclassified Sporosarcina TaxID=2647733 RepID=UPI000C16C4C6|nr:MULTISPECIES: 50S ribosomal protein L25/general stress protein Ctc [unclassified Sporosarcina]PIC69589.1 50S ribosomal protein L25/general stress protein Ctc [Sporosarcina sp. P16b]PID01166.1 50S ribosomal protein L25/general stress protein Ctc [Sporosarcina sp. P2]PID23728.1 50S ribosomal protein L25/general stress protein Ctc [Sporosarcina sp. P7]
MSTIKSNLRETDKKTVSELRKSGWIPSVVYGYKTESTPIAVKERDLLDTLRETGRNGVIKLTVDGNDVNVVLNDYQSDVLTGFLTHADFLAINMTEELEVDVAINLVGNAPGEKAGGTIQQPVWEVTIRVKPSDIPDHIDVDVSELEIGETILVSDIRDKVKFEILTEDEVGLVTISAPRTEEEMEALDEATESTEAEPEVIGEDKEEK